MADALFSKLSDDVVLNIFFKLDEDPRNWARLACVCTKFSSMIRAVCWKHKCSTNIPSVLSDLLSSSSSSSPPGGWAALHKLSVCCPGLVHAGVLLDNSDFGLERELGPDESYVGKVHSNQTCTKSQVNDDATTSKPTSNLDGSEGNSWSLYDDLYYDTMYNVSDSQEGGEVVVEEGGVENVKAGKEVSVSKRRKICRPMRSHLASGIWNLSREQGSKLLGRQFRDDCLYICDSPWCEHIEEKRNYKLFRGIFKNFKRSRVWRTINDGNRTINDRSKVGVNCAFCPCKETWDLFSAFCLKRSFGYHEDGEPVVRAYVCENGHISGAWTDSHLYT